MAYTPEEQSNINAFRIIIERIINDGEVERCDEMMSADMSISRYGLAATAALLVPGAPAPTASPIEGFKMGLTRLRAAFPDWHHEIQTIVAKDDMVSGTWRLTCTHSGAPFMGVEPSGRSISIEEAGFQRFANGKMIEGWFICDELNFVRQLGVDLAK